MRIATWTGLFLAVLTALCHPAQAWTPQRLGVDKAQLVQNLLPGQLPVGSTGEHVMVEIDKAGRVVSARWPMSDADDAFRPNAQQRDTLLAVARNLRFKPFEWQGRPVAVVGLLPLPDNVMRGEKWAEGPAQPFPPITVNAEIEISLTRLFTCWAPCPAYRVRIDGHGNVFFDGGDITPDGLGSGVIVQGQFQARIDPATVTALLDQFRREEFLDLRDAHDGQVSDGRSSVISLRIGNVRKRVWQDEGEYAGLPPGFHRLEQAIDRAAETERWVTGNARTVPSLRDTGFDFTSPSAIRMLRLALALRNEDLLLALIDEDLPWDGIVPNYLTENIIEEMDRPPLPLGPFIVTWAIRQNMDRLFTKLRDRGWLARVPLADLQDAFKGASRCNPVIDSALQAAGIDLSRRNAETVFPYYEDRLIPTPETDAGFLACLQDALKADPDRADIQAFALRSPALAHWLMVHGHRPRLYDGQGQLGYLETGQDGLLLSLLAVGLDPRGPDGTARQLRERAVAVPLPATLEWLDMHGVE